VSFIHDNSAVVVQVLVPETLSQQHTVSHVLDHCFVGGAIFETDRETNLHEQEESRTKMGSLRKICLTWFLGLDTSLTKWFHQVKWYFDSGLPLKFPKVE
jgi:hypothetical protein